MARKQTFKRRPNKAGTVVKLSGKRRRPYCAKITTGKDIITGRQIQKSIGCYETWQEADDALTLYRLGQKKAISNQEIADLAPDTYQQLVERREKNMPTFEELYDKVLIDFIYKLSPSAQRRYKANYKRLKNIYTRKINSITLQELQDIINTNKDTVSKDSLKNMKLIIKKVFAQGIISGAIKKDDDLTDFLNIDTDFKTIEIKHTSFSINEIKILLKDGSFESKLVLIYIFTGARPSELLNLPKENIHINEECEDDGKKKIVSYLICGIKTESGKNRIIPIHNIIKPFIIEILNDNDYFMTYTQKVPYEAYKRDIFYPLMKRLGLKHYPHDTRHTFGTLATLNNLDNYMVKKILGHKFQDLTKDVYTHILINKLFDEIQKIKI